MNNNILIDKMTELYLRNYDIETDNNIKSTIQKIQFVDSQINSFKKDKPFFLFKKDRKEYNDRISKLEELRDILYNSLGKEIPKKQPDSVVENINH